MHIFLEMIDVRVVRSVSAPHLLSYGEQNSGLENGISFYSLKRLTELPIASLLCSQRSLSSFFERCMPS